MALIGALGFVLVVGITSERAIVHTQPTQKPNIVFIIGDDIGWMQPSIYHQGLMVGETPNIDRIGQEGATSRCRTAPPGSMPFSPACIRCAPA
jgi:arylsulfatase